MFTKLFPKLWTASVIEMWCANRLDYFFTHLFKGGPKGFIATIAAIGQIFSFIISRDPVVPFGETVDLSGYELVFEDEFDGKTLDLDIWHHRGVGANNKGFLDPCQVSLSDGNLHIKGSYLKDGPQGDGWYSGSIALNKRYKYGYFECRCKVNKGNGFWSAFWIQHENSASKASNGGVNGVEIDIMESCANNSDVVKDKNCVIQCMHVNGGTDDTTDDVDTTGAYFIQGDETDVYEDYNTYSMMWNEEEYIFYMNGVESWRSSWRDGPSTVAEEIILTLCAPHIDMSKNHAEDYTTEFLVDYIRIYQLKK